MKIDSNTFKIRCSQIGKIMSGSFGLSETQNRDLEQLITKSHGEKGLTSIQQKKHDDLLYKRENPELSQTAKTYLDGWIKEKVARLPLLNYWTFSAMN